MKKISKYTTLLAAAVFSVYSCVEPVDPQPQDEPTGPASLEIHENLVQADGEGGEYIFTYTLTNPDNITVLEAECSEDWVNSFDLSAEGVVSFTVDPNPDMESRIVNVYLKYGKISDKIVVSQSGITAENFTASFDICYDIDGPYVTMNVIPEPENIRYYAWYYSVEGMENALAQSPGVTVEMYLKRLVEVELSNAIYYGSYAGYTAEQAIAEITLKGASSQQFELNGETSFYGFACAVSDGGEVLSEVTVTEFTTGTVPPSDNRLEIIVDQVNSDRISYSVKTTCGDQYASYILHAEEIEGKSDAEIVEMFNDTENYIDYLKFGDYSGTILVEEDSDYCILAFGFEYGMATTEIHREKVHTLKADPSVIPEISISIDKVTHYRIKASTQVEPFTSLYYFDYCYGEDTAEDAMKMVREAAEWYVNNGYYPDLASCMKVMGVKGSRTMEFEALSPETSYKVFAIGIDETTGEFNTEVIFSDVITTPAQKVSESHIDIPIGKYFDGFDLAEVYPDEFADAEGWAVLPLEVSVTGDVTDYYYDVYVGDLTAADGPTDDELILDLAQYGKYNEPLTMSYCYFYETLTLAYYSKDSDDNNSPVTRIVFQMTPEGCAPVSSFNYTSASAHSRSPRKLDY